MKTLRIATRKSPLALWQANEVKTRLESAHPGLTVELVSMTTAGDKMLDAPLAKVGGKGLFVKALEQALLNHEADIAVHSMKDMPVHLPPGLTLSSYLVREDARDALVANSYQSLAEIPVAGCIGTSSLRRRCMLHALRPDLVIKVLRGNLQTRLQKLDRGEYDGILLATAGLVRMGLGQRVTERLSTEMLLPAVGQAIIGIEQRDDDHAVYELVRTINHCPAEICITAERAMNQALNGGCQVPIAGYAELTDSDLRMRGLVGRVDGSILLSAEKVITLADGDVLIQAAQLGLIVASELQAQGADAILAEVYRGG